MIVGATIAWVAGVHVVYWAVEAASATQVDTSPEVSSAGLAGAALSAILLLFVLLVGFMVFRIGRALRRELRPGSASPTTVSDIWRMHRLPEEDDEQDEDVVDDDPSST